MYMYGDPIKRADSNQLIPFNVHLYMYIRFLCSYNLPSTMYTHKLDIPDYCSDNNNKRALKCGYIILRANYTVICDRIYMLYIIQDQSRRFLLFGLYYNILRTFFI